MELTLIQKIAVFALPVIFAITLHEAAHGYVARFFGDMTAAEKKCETTVVNFTDIVKDEIIQCQKVTEKKCYTSQETIFDTFTVKI